MAKVEEISTCIIQANNNGNAGNSCTPKIIELTPWDLQLLLVDSIQKGLLFKQPNPQLNKHRFHNFLHHLKVSLSHTLNFFPPLAGRLATSIQNDTQIFFINCNNSGAQFTHAIAHGLTVNDILNPKCGSSTLYSFFSLNGAYNFQVIYNPLLAVRVTELQDGYFIGCTINHCVADGTSFWHFFNSWSEISRGYSFPSKKPVLERWFPGNIKSPVHIPLLETMSFDEYTPPLLKERVFHFSKENIANLKSNANKSNSSYTVSSLQAVLAHIWRSVIRCRTKSNSREEVSFKLLIGARQRLKPLLPEGYFGNAVHITSVTTTSDELLSHRLDWAARRLNEAVKIQTGEETRAFYENWIKKPRIVSKGEVVRNSLIASSSPRFDVYGNDFGWGKPVAVRRGAGNKSDGKVTLFSGRDGGSIDVELCLLEGTLDRMEKDVEFLEFVNISKLGHHIHQNINHP